MRSITTLDLQYAHRFYGFKGEAQYLHGHTGVLTIEVEDTVEPGVNMVFPCNEIQKTAWEVLKNFDHALILREDDPLLPAILSVYEAQGIRNGAPTNKMKGPAFQTELATAYPECRLVVTKETMTVEGMIKIVYDLLKDKLNIAKLTFTSGVNAASQEYTPSKQIDRCPLCGIALNEKGVCPKCGYKKALALSQKPLKMPSRPCTGRALLRLFCNCSAAVRKCQVNDRLAEHPANNAAPNVGRGHDPAEQVGYMLGCVRRGYAKPLVHRRGLAPALRWVQR